VKFDICTSVISVQVPINKSNTDHFKRLQNQDASYDSDSQASSIEGDVILTVDDVRNVFKQFGEILRVDILNNQLKTKLWVEFSNPESTARVVVGGNLYWNGLNFYVYPSRIQTLTIKRNEEKFSYDFSKEPTN